MPGPSDPSELRDEQTPADTPSADSGQRTLSVGGTVPTGGDLSSNGDATQPIFSPDQTVASRYRIIRFIARGGMGEVYEAEDLELGGRIALKTIRPQIARDDKALERFRREIYLSRRVTHPNVCRIFDLSRHVVSPEKPGKPELQVIFLTMELLEGETLADQLRARGRMKPDEALPIVRQLAQALTAAHRAGVVHRDFKSRNVMLIRESVASGPADGSLPSRSGNPSSTHGTPVSAGREGISSGRGERLSSGDRVSEHRSRSSGKTPEPTAGIRVVVTDFGLASAISSGEDFSDSLTASGDMLGTPAYMAPEQVEGKEVGPAADLYALGVVMYEMVTGAKPFVGDSPMSTALRRLTEHPLPPRVLAPDLDPRWETTILRCLERHPWDRFEDARELVDALQGQNVAPSRRQMLRRRRVSAGVAAAGILALAAAWLATVAQRGPTLGLQTAEIGLGRRAIAVLGFKNLSGDRESAWLSTALSEMLSTELASGGRLRVVPGEDVNRMKLELGVSDAESLAGDTLQRIRGHLGVDFVVVGSTIALGTGAGRPIRVDVRLQDAEAGETLSSPSESGTEDELFDVVSRVGRKLRDRLGVEQPSAADAAGAHAMLPADPEAARLYSEGLNRLWQFDAVGARDLLEKAVAAEPNRAQTHSALAEAWSALGYDGRARDEAKRAFELSSGLPREQKLAVEARYRETMGEWAKAVEINRVLFGFFPDSLRYGLLLVRAQRSAGQGREALQTLAELRRLPPPDGDDPMIDLAEAETADQLSDSHRQLEAARRAANKGVERGARLLVAQAQIWQGLAHWNLGEREAAIAAYQEAQRLSTDAGDLRGTARAQRFLAYALAHAGELDEARRMYAASLGSFREIGDRGGIQWALNGMALLLQDQGELADARRSLEESLAASREIGDSAGTARTLQNLSGVLALEGRLVEAKDRAKESMTEFARMGDERGEAWSKLRLADAGRRQGDLSGARKLLEESLATFRKVGNPAGIAWVLTRRGDLETALGELASARITLTEALGIREKLQEKGFLAETVLALAELELAEGHPHEALSLAGKAEAELGAVRRRDGQALALSTAVHAQLSLQNVAGAQEAAGRARAFAEPSEAPRVRLRAQIAFARARGGSGRLEDLEAARVSLEEARAMATTVGLAQERLQATLALALTERELGLAEPARSRLESLRAEADSNGFGLLARQASEALRQAGGDSPS